MNVMHFRAGAALLVIAGALLGAEPEAKKVTYEDDVLPIRSEEHTLNSSHRT